MFLKVHALIDIVLDFTPKRISMVKTNASLLYINTLSLLKMGVGTSSQATSFVSMLAIGGGGVSLCEIF